MKTETKLNLIAYPIALFVIGLIIAVALWGAMSAVDSFVELDWRSVTATPRGRAVFAALWVYLMVSNCAKLFSSDDRQP